MKEFQEIRESLEASDADEALEKALRQLDPGTPPSNLLARCLTCLAAVPETSEQVRTRAPFAPLRPRVLFSCRRLAIAAVMLLAISLLITWPFVRKDGSAGNSAAAFAETISAMQRVSAWSTTSHQISFDPGEPGANKPKFRYNFTSGWRVSQDRFDASRGLYSEQLFEPLGRNGVDSPDSDDSHEPGPVQRMLMLPSGDWLFRRADEMGWDKVRVNRMGVAYWRKTRDEQLRNIRTPAYWASNFGTPASAPPTRRAGSWKGKTSAVYTFVVHPSQAYQKNDPPSKRIEIYVDPETRLITVRREFSFWSNHPERGEKITWVQEFDYSTTAQTTLFDAREFCAGTQEIQTRQGGPGVVLDPQ